MSTVEPCPLCGSTRAVVDTAPGMALWLCRDCGARSVEEVVEPCR